MTGKSMFDAALSYDEPVGVFARSGNLEVRLAGSKAELREAQRLRYRIFFEEMQARATGKARVTRLDIDPFDKFCDHLLVLDRGRRRGQQVVGCYRLLRQEIARFGYELFWLYFCSCKFKQTKKKNCYGDHNYR